MNNNKTKTMDDLHFFDWDWSRYEGKEAPFVVRHPDGRAQVVSEWDEDGTPMRVPGFCFSKEEADQLTDKAILMAGLEVLRRLHGEVAKMTNHPIIKGELDFPEVITGDNKFDCDFFPNWSPEGKVTFNFLYEVVDRNRDQVFALDLFRLNGFTSDQIKKVYDIVNASHFNMCVLAAEFVTKHLGDIEIDDENE